MNPRWRQFLACAVLLIAGLVAPLVAQDSSTPILIAVDASDAPRKIIHSRLTFPVKPGALTLFYPKWIPGEHGPTGPINSLTNLRFTVAGAALPWQRDPVDMYAFHCEIPSDASTLDVTLDNVMPPNGGSASAQLAILNWNQLLVYPGGVPSDRLMYRASVRLPANWRFGTALPVEKTVEGATDFATVSLTTLVDSPVVAGAHYRNVMLTADDAKPSSQIDIVADSAAALALPDDVIGRFKKLVVEAANLHGGTHYEHYHFLVALSDHIPYNGIEHHESSVITMPERAWIDKGAREGWSDLLPHELTHSWNGKYRRPASLTTPDFQEPMQGDLLWVYEGLTEYTGSFVLTQRSGLCDADWNRDGLAVRAADMDSRSGRTWRDLQDTATAASVLYVAPGEWADLRRGVDFYSEGVLLWLEVDTVIRQQTNGQKSLDDFCHAFHGGPSGPPSVLTYTFDDVVIGLNSVAAYDWSAFLRQRLDSLTPHATLGGIENSGWRLVYNDQPNKVVAGREEERKLTNLSWSLGCTLREDGTVADVRFGGPVAAAGITPGMKVVAVNGRAWSAKVIREALNAAKADNAPPVELLILNDDFYRTVPITYHGGERYPHLERDPAKPDLLEAICKPHGG